MSAKSSRGIAACPGGVHPPSVSSDVTIEPSAAIVTSLQPSRYGPPSARAHRTAPALSTATTTQSDAPAARNRTGPKSTVPANHPVPTAPFASASMSNKLSSPVPPKRCTHSGRPNWSKRARGMSARPALVSVVPPSVTDCSNLPVTNALPPAPAAMPSNSSSFVGPDMAVPHRTAYESPGGTGG